MPPMPDELTSARLAETYRRAEAIRLRRRLAGGAVAVVVLLVAGLAGVAWPGGGGDEVRTVAGPDGDATTTTAPPDTILDTTTPEPPVTDTTEPGMVTTTTAKPRSGGDGGATATTTTTKACRNSPDPACGPFRWDPEPVNRPMVVEASFSPQVPKVGEEVVFTVRVRDDGPVASGGCLNYQSYGDGTNSPRCTIACVPPPEYGPWDPPPPDNASIVETFRHTYSDPGTFTAEFVYSGASCIPNPYRSGGKAAVQVTVTP